MPRFDGGQLVGVADKRQTAVGGQGVQEFGHQGQVNHAGLIDDKPVDGQGIVMVVLEGDQVVV